MLGIDINTQNEVYLQNSTYIKIIGTALVIFIIYFAIKAKHSN